VYLEVDLDYGDGTDLEAILDFDRWSAIIGTGVSAAGEKKSAGMSISRGLVRRLIRTQEIERRDRCSAML
jgi:hypothetical protein